MRYEAGLHRFETAWGPCALRWSETGLAQVILFAAQAPDESEASATARRWIAAMQAYFRGEPVDFSQAPLDVSGLSELDRDLYAVLRRVERGSVVTYGDLAMRVGRPGAARAVGGAMARNPWPIVVPCHRVLAKGGEPGGFSAPGGLSTKRRLLAMEGVALEADAPMLPGLFGD